MTQFFSPKQLQFIKDSTAKWNFAHGAVRTGKTYCTLWAFLHAAYTCPDSNIWMIGHTSSSIYENAIRLIFENDKFAIFRPFCTWHPGKGKLKFMDKTIGTLGAKDEGAIGNIQGKTFSLVYCDEMTLYPESIIQMINSRLSNPYSKGFASMNPTHPRHIIKQWIDMGDEGDKNFYSLHFELDDNDFLTEDYKVMLKKTSSGIFYKRNILGLWVMAEGAIYDFFDEDVYVVERPPAAADYWICGIDYGASNPFVCLLIGVSTGQKTQTGKVMWVEKEYYWDPKTKRQKLNSEFAEDIEAFLDGYYVQAIYIDPSAESFQQELQRRNLPVLHANNDVWNGIQKTADTMQKGNLFILANCQNLIREIQGYVWDPKASEKGWDEPMKKDDHCADALRYAIASHEISEYNPYKTRSSSQQSYKSRYPGGKQMLP